MKRNKFAMEQRGKITLPSVTEIDEVIAYSRENELGLPEVSDFAMASGVDTFSHIGETANYGFAWTRNIGDFYRDRITIVRISNSAYDGYFGSPVAEINCRSIAVMPRIQDPESLGFNIQKIGNKSFLTFKEQLTHWPKKHMNTQHKNDNTANIKMYYHLLNPRYKAIINTPCMAEADKYLIKYWATQPDRFRSVLGEFNDSGKCLSGKEYKFQIEPIPAMRCQDGSIQCLDMMLAMPFDLYAQKLPYCNPAEGQELDTDKFTIGKYLNHEFLYDLQQSTRLQRAKLTKLNDNFSTENLRPDHTQDYGKEPKLK